MQSIHGSFSIHRTKTVDGRDAILLVPSLFDEFPLTFLMDDQKDESAEIHFMNVQGGSSMPTEYLTLLYPDDYKIHLGPYVPPVT